MALLEATSTLDITTLVESRFHPTNLAYFSAGNNPGSGRGSGLIVKHNVGFNAPGGDYDSVFACWYRATPAQIDTNGSLIYGTYSDRNNHAFGFRFQKFYITPTGIRIEDNSEFGGYFTWTVTPINFASKYLDDAWHLIIFKLNANRGNGGSGSRFAIDGVEQTMSQNLVEDTLNITTSDFRVHTAGINKHDRMFCGDPIYPSDNNIGNTTTGENIAYRTGNEFGGKIHYIWISNGGSRSGPQNITLEEAIGQLWGTDDRYIRLLGDGSRRNLTSPFAHTWNDDVVSTFVVANKATSGVTKPHLRMGSAIGGSFQPRAIFQISETAPNSYVTLLSGADPSTTDIGDDPAAGVNGVAVNFPRAPQFAGNDTYTLVNFTINDGKIKFYDDDTLGLSITTAVNLIAGFLVEGEFRIRSNVAIGNNYTEADFVNQNFVDNGILTEILKLATCNIDIQVTAQTTARKDTSAAAQPTISSTVFTVGSRLGELLADLDISLSTDTRAGTIKQGNTALTITTAVTTSALDLDEALISVSTAMSVEAVAKKTTSTNIDIQSQLTVNINAQDLDIANAALLAQSDIIVVAEKIAGAAALLNLAVSVEALGSKQKLASSTLDITTDVVINANANKSALIDQQIETALLATAADIDLAELSISSGLLVDAVAIKIARSTININTSLQVDTIATELDLANLSISSAMFISAIAAKTARARITANSEMAVVADGMFFNVDPYYVYKILAETRLNTLVRETRAYKIMQETRDYKIRVPVLATPQTRRNS
jgi:hypothetical protein